MTGHSALHHLAMSTNPQVNAKANDEAKTIMFSKKSDLTLVSSDGVRFHVSSSMMSEASEIFEGMLGIPQPIDTSMTDERVVKLEENAATLKLLLSWIYPHDNRPVIKSFGQLALYSVLRRSTRSPLECFSQC